jgi:hypothetical protein
MTNAEIIVEFLKLPAANSYCDDCIADLCELKQRQQSASVTSTLSLTAEYDREEGECRNCGQTKLVIRKLAN